ncbi:MAG: DnaD domain protein [Clostridiales bacterium]|jgi:DnaD/phage-associated family protein|nr:DnaD domain protein [Clostridiales bacterium]
MNLKINPSLQWGAVFQVPACVVDKHLKIASPEQIKVLLWVLRHASDSPKLADICAALKCEEGDAEDCLKFWAQRGIFLYEDAESDKPLQPKSDAAGERSRQAAKNPPLEPIPLVSPTSEQILARTKESSEIAFLFNESQKKLGRTIGYDTQCVLLMIHDQYGLPVEVILMIIEYCVSINKISIAYISAVGKDWAEKEIDTIEKADEQIEMLRRCNGIWKKFAALAGISNPRPTSVQSEYIRTWTYELSFDVDMIFLAYEEMANHCTRLSFAYMNKILKNWHSEGIKTHSEVAEASKKRLEKRSRSAAKKSDSKSNASYDIEEYKRSTIHDPIVYKKKKKV